MKVIILIVSMALLVTIAATEPQVSLENNIDRPGMNYKSYFPSSADPQVCATDCANDPNCKAFTYVKPGFRGPNSQPECWLKNGVPNPVSQEYCISGVKATATPASPANPTPSSASGINLENNIDRPGMSYKSYFPSSADPQVCATDCANDPNCKAFTYVKPGFRGPNSQPECWLKNGVPEPVSQEYCVSGVKATSDSIRSAYSGPSINDMYSSVPGLVLHLWNNMNQPDPQLDSTRQDLIFLDGGDLGAPRDCGYYWWMVPDQDVNPIAWSAQLPPGLVLGLRHSSNQENDGRITVGGQNVVHGSNTYGGLVKQNGGDIGGSEGEGYYWYETYNLNFQNWDDAEKYLPKGTVMGLKHYPNQRDKKVYWRGQEYDPVECFVNPQAFPSPPTFAPKNGGDQGASSGLGYYWFEKITGPDYFQPGSAKVNTICGHAD